MKINLVKIVCLFTFISSFVYAQEDGSASVANRAIAKSNYQKNMEKYKDNKNFMVLPGLVADKSNHKVTIDGEVTELSSGEPSELYVIYDKSSHGYEALAYSFATPVDIVKALKFLGMQSGQAVDSINRVLWPKGERVFVNFVVDPKSKKEVPMKDFVIYTKTGKNPDERLSQVFTGSVMIDDFEDSEKKNLMADSMDPYGIATSYVEPGSIMTTPDNISKGRAYGSVTSGPLLPPKGTPITIVLRPEYIDGKQRMQYYDLNVATNSSNVIVYNLKQNGEEFSSLTLDVFLKTMVNSVDKGHDPFVNVEFNKNLAIGTIKQVAGLLQEIESVNGIRIDEPTDDEPFFKTFLPNEEFRNRQKRYSQPCELWLSETNSVVSVEIIKPTATYLENQIEPRISVKKLPIENMTEYRKILDDNSDSEVKVLLIFAPSDMQYGKVYKYIKPIIKDYPTIYIFTI